MPQPEGKTLTISTYLTNLAVGMIPGTRQFIASRLLPNLPVNARRGIYFEWETGSFLRPEGKELANAEPAPIGGFEGKQERTYRVGKYGIATNWTDEDLSEAENGPMGARGLELRKVRYVTEQALLNLELQTASLIRGNGWGLDLAGVDAVTDPATQFLRFDDDASEPIKLLKWIIRRFQFRTGIRPNTMLMPGTVVDVLTEHPEFIDRIKYGSNANNPAIVRTALLAQLLGIPNIVEAESVHNTALEGQASNMVWTWGHDIWIGYVAPEGAMDIESPSAAYRFSWVGNNGVRPSPFQAAANPQGIYINRFNSQRPAAYWAEAYRFSTPKIVASDLGCILRDAITAPTF